MRKIYYLFTLLPLLHIAYFANAQELTTELIVIESDLLKCNDSIRVYTPKELSTKKLSQKKSLKSQNPPTLFLLHGWSGNYKNWGDKFDLQAISNRTGFRIICPDGFYNSWYLNNTDESKMQWRCFFDKELYPQMVKKYNLDPKKTFITGLSMGGHGAINIFIDDTTRFRAAGSMSGVLDLHHTKLTVNQISKILGDYNKNYDLYTEASAINRIDQIKDSKKILIISCGYDDQFTKSASQFTKRCRELNIPSIEIQSPGKHNWDYWEFGLEQHIWIFSKILNGDNLGYK